MADVVWVTNAGLSILTNRILGAGTEPKWIAWGTGTTTATAINTALVSEASPTRVTGTSTQQTSTTTCDTYQVTGTLTATSALTISECGLFDASSAGNCFLRATFDAINVSSGDSIAFTIKAVFDQA
ncbi:MAG: hypothetical protein WC477_05930 [Patescibacteria group bacterium]